MSKTATSIGGSATSDAEQVEPLTDTEVRALTEYMTVMLEEPGLFSVTTESGSEYLVDLWNRVCDCPDAFYDQSAGEHCKHVDRVLFALEKKSVPEWVEDDAVDSQLGEHVEPTDAE